MLIVFKVCFLFFISLKVCISLNMYKLFVLSMVNLQFEISTIGISSLFCNEKYNHKK